MKKTTNTYTAAAANATGFASNVTGASWALTNLLTSDNLAHKVTIHGDAATNHSGKTATIVGTDANGRPQTETGLALPNGAVTVTSTKYFRSIESVTPSATIGGDTMDIGWAVDAVSPWQDVMGTREDGPFNLGFATAIASGSPTYSVQNSYDDESAFTHATVAAKTDAQQGGITVPCSSVRLLLTAAGGVTLTTIR